MTALMNYAFCVLFFFSFPEVGLKWLNIWLFTLVSEDKIASSSPRCHVVQKPWSVSECFFCLVFDRGLFNVPEKSWRCSSVCFNFISRSKILCCGYPPVKEAKMGFLILIGQRGNTCRVTNFFLSLLNIVFCFFVFPMFTVWKWDVSSRT